MCGIAGILGKKQNSGLLLSAVRCLQHRGPDEEGTWRNEEGTVALGHRRLSIIDLTAAAAQPMIYEGRYVIIHNGELYNFVEIKKELQQKGYSFHSNSDTEAIVAAYDQWGKGCLQKFDGMFAFAIWDIQERKLFAARDRFCEKPFFFFYDDQQLLFASEMKALWKLGVDKKVNGSMLYNFLTIGYTTNPAEPRETFFEDISKLPPASFLFYSSDTHQLEIEKYWDLDVEVKAIAEEEAIEEFDSLFTSSISKRLRSDVAIGTSLSGGLDSSAVVAFCDKVASSQYSHKCFTASFAGFEKDETHLAKKMAAQFGLQHYTVGIEETEIVTLMEKVMESQEAPFSSGSPLAQYKVYQTARNNDVTVLLDGQGADEVLAGYNKYYNWYWRELYRSDKRTLAKELDAAKKLGIPERFSFQQKIVALLPEFSAGLHQGRKARQAFNHDALNRDFAFTNKRNLYYSTPTGFDLNGILYYNTMTNGLEELLQLADRNSMAHATEVRLPYLSHQLVEFLFTLPANLKIRNGWTKWLLRKASEKKLPTEITWRKDKVGFEPPQQKWMENKQVQEAIMEGKQLLVDKNIINSGCLKKVRPHTAYAAHGLDWKLWSASWLFRP
jgi:asparagine synthase (glutamine-hydrolysing)